MSDFISVENLQSSLSVIKSNSILLRWGEILCARAKTVALKGEDGATHRTFEAIHTEAEDFARQLGRLQDGVLVLATGNVPEWPALLLAAWMLGRQVIPSEPLNEEAVAALNETGVVVTSEKGKLNFCEISRGTGSGLFPDAVLFKLTSGTTSEPRKIAFTADQLMADADSICATMGITTRDWNYGLISFAHSYGFSNLVLTLLCHGVPLVVARDMLPRAIMEGLTRSGASVFPGVPAIFRVLAGFPAQLPALRLCISAGAPLPHEVARRFFAAWGVKIHSFYGASECGGICYDASEEVDVPEGWVGPAMKGVRLVDRSEEGEGLMAVESGAVGLGYSTAFADDALSGGQFRPSDLLEQSHEGYRIVGRSSDFINVAGRKVNPVEIERVLRAHDGVRDAVVFALEESGRGESIAACVATESSMEQLRSHCASRLPSWQVPRDWFLLDELPVNARGKISRPALRKAAGEGSLQRTTG